MTSGTFMRLLVAGLLFGGSAALSAAPCAPGSVAAYVAGPACEVGAFSFSDFAVEPFPSATSQIAPASVMFIPITNGFELAGATPLSAVAGDLLGLRLLFHVEGLLGGGSATLDPSAQAARDGVITAVLNAGPAGSAIPFATESLTDLSESFTSPLTSFFDVQYELGIDGGTAGRASLGPSFGTVVFAPIPEPQAAVLLAAGVALLLLLRRRARHD